MILLNRGPESGKALLGRKVLVVVSPNPSVFIRLIKLSKQDEVDDSRKTLQ